MGADLGVAVAQHAGALLFQFITRGQDVVDLVADVMDAAVRKLLQELGDRRVVAQRLQEFDLGVREGDENDGDAMLRLLEPDRSGLRRSAFL